MRRGRGSWWWAQIMKSLVYLALGIMSAGLAVWVSSGYPRPIRVGIVVLSWVLGLLIIDLRITPEIVTEEENEK